MIKQTKGVGKKSKKITKLKKISIYVDEGLETNRRTKQGINYKQPRKSHFSHSVMD